MKSTPHYSGDASEDFWKRVNSVPASKHGECYALGCALQNLESQVLRALDNAEVKRPKRKRAPLPPSRG